MRLNKYTRNKIASNAIADKYDKILDELLLEEVGLINEVISRVYNDEQKDFMKKYPKMFMSVNVFRVNAGGYSIDLGNSYAFDYEKSNGKFHQLVSYEHRYHGNGPILSLSLLVEKETDLCSRIRDHSERLQSVLEERKNNKRLILTMLESIYSTNKLLEIWPEGLPYYKDLDKTIKVNVPVVKIDEINKALGLPKDEVTECVDAD